MARELVQVAIRFLEDVKAEESRGDHLAVGHQFRLELRVISVSSTVFLLLDDTQCGHLLGSSRPALHDLEAGDAHRDSFVGVALAEPEDVLLKDEVLGAEYLPLQVGAKLLRLRQPGLVLELEEDKERSDRVLLRGHHVSQLAPLDLHFKMSIVGLLLYWRHHIVLCSL